MTTWRRHPVLSEPRVLIGAGILLSIVAVAALAPLIAPHDPNNQDLLRMLVPPFWKAGADPDFPLGTDGLGRCIMSRLIYGARVAVIVGTVVPIGTALLGASIALVAGYWAESVELVGLARRGRHLDVVSSSHPFPGPYGRTVAWLAQRYPRYHSGRLDPLLPITRGAILGLMKLDYVASARIAGATHVQVMLKVPSSGVFPIIVTLFSVEIGIAVIMKSVLSFVGVSVEPHIPTWGVMIADGLVTVFAEPWELVLPMMAIILTVLGANMLGDGLRLSLDPRLASRPSLEV